VRRMDVFQGLFGGVGVLEIDGDVGDAFAGFGLAGEAVDGPVSGCEEEIGEAASCDS